MILKMVVVPACMVLRMKEEPQNCSAWNKYNVIGWVTGPAV